MPVARSHRLIASLLVPVMAGVGACAKAVGISSTSAEGAAPGSDPGCQVQSHHGGLRPGVGVVEAMSVVNDGRTCIWGAGMSGVAQGNPDVSDKPAHGTVQVEARGQSVIYGYRPTPGYVGRDSFTILLRRGDGFDNPLTVSVSVHGPEG